MHIAAAGTCESERVTKMESVYADKKRCCGCGACQNTCPVGAIVMVPDGEGFLYPTIDRQKCTDCRNCLAVCPLLWHRKLKEAAEPTFYAAKHKREEVLMRSSSGGAFTAISDVILKRGGVVYGADFGEGFRVEHARANTEAGRDRFCRSKYAQSVTHNAYANVVRDLREGRTVLFTGTPCQTAGLRGLMRRRMYPENLYACDVICHSVPSPLVWSDFKKLLEKENGDRVAEVYFRTKARPWTRENMNTAFQYRLAGESDYRFDRRFFDLFFLAGTIVRRSCYVCPFTDIHRASDVTIADYMGIEKYMPDFYDTRGVSLVMSNSSKGEALFEEAKKDLIFHKRPAAEALAEQKRLSSPAAEPEALDEFWREYRERGLAHILETY